MTPGKVDGWSNLKNFAWKKMSIFIIFENASIKTEKSPKISMTLITIQVKAKNLLEKGREAPQKT